MIAIVNPAKRTLFTVEERIDMCFHHLNYLLQIKDEKVAILEMRGHIAWYIKGMPNSTTIKNECFKAKSKEEIEKILNNYLKELKSAKSYIKLVAK